jgi:SET domain-containing protein
LEESVDEASPRQRTQVRSPGDKYLLDVGPSAIDGLGAFAGEPIPARRKIGEIRGEPLTVKEARQRVKGQRRIMMVELSARTAIDASASTHALRFTNHSCRPNAILRIVQGRVELYALRALATGEEITVDYGETHHQGRLRCRCGATGCLGRI